MSTLHHESIYETCFDEAYENFRISLLLDRWPTLTQKQMKIELHKQQLNRIVKK